jgi:hypothetical protein
MKPLAKLLQGPVILLLGDVPLLESSGKTLHVVGRVVHPAHHAPELVRNAWGAGPAYRYVGSPTLKCARTLINRAMLLLDPFPLLGGPGWATPGANGARSRNLGRRANPHELLFCQVDRWSLRHLRLVVGIFGEALDGPRRENLPRKTLLVLFFKRGRLFARPAFAFSKPDVFLLGLVLLGLFLSGPDERIAYLSGHPLASLLGVLLR